MSNNTLLVTAFSYTARMPFNLALDEAQQQQPQQQ